MGGPLRPKTLTEREEEVKEEYLKTLQDLTFNSKPLIDVLTEVADENREYAACIVDCIEEQLDRVSGPLKLPILYLIDSIIKFEAIKQYYLPLFSRNIHKLFMKVYELSDDNVRNKLAKLRFTWNGVLPAETLAALDNLVRSVNPSWQTAPPPAVHVNPKFISPSVAATSAVKLNSVATKEELRQKQRELFALTQRKEELEQELKVLRPAKTKSDECKTTEKLISVVNEVLTQAEKVRRSGTCNPAEVQRVRESAGVVKNSMHKIIECIPTVPRYASFAKNLPILNELVNKLTDTEKVLAELEKSNLCKRKVILADKTASSSTDVSATFTQQTVTTVPTCSNLPARNWNKSSPNQYSLVNKANGSLAAQPQNPPNQPTFRIAPVSSQLINAAARRARDPRLQKRLENPPQKKSSITETTVAVVNGRREAAEPASRITESKNDKRNESPDQPNVSRAAASKKPEVSSKSKSAAYKDSSSVESTSEEKAPTAKKRKVDKSEAPAKSESSRKSEDTNHPRKRKAELDGGDDKARKTESPSPEKRKSNGTSATKRKSEMSKKAKSSLSTAIDELFEDAPKKTEPKKSNASKTLSEEERQKKLRILAHTHAQETERMLESLRKDRPKVAEKFIRLLNKEKETMKASSIVDVDADSSAGSETKSPSHRGSEPDPEDDSGDVDCVIVTSYSPKLVNIEEKMKSPPKLEPLDEYDPFGELLSLDEPAILTGEPQDEPKVEPASCSPRAQDMDLRSLMAPGSVMMPPPVSGTGPVMMPAVSAALMPPVSASVMVPAVTCKSPPSAPAPPPLFPFLVPNMEFGFPKTAPFGMPPASATAVEVPEANQDLLGNIDRDPMTTINIDDIPREIRHYGSTAVVFLSWDDPKQISFSSSDVPRRVVVDNKYTISCMLNAPDVESLIYGKPHKFRLGAPTRELYIDGIGYECYFRGASIKVRFDGRLHLVRLEGEPPKVDIGNRRLDLVAGKIEMVINDKHTFPVFLDAKPQKIEVEGFKFIIMFIDSLQRVLINDVPFTTDFGGLSQSFRHCGRILSFRFSMLPVGIIPGAVNIHQMITSKLPPPPPLPPSLRYSANDDFPVLPVPPIMPNVPIIPVSSLPPPMLMNCPEPGIPLDIDNRMITKEASSISPTVHEDSSAPEALSIDELMQQLLAKGLVSLPEPKASEERKSTSPPASTSRNETNTTNKTETVKPVDLKRSETLKQRQPAMISMLYTGNQCGSCGLRFPPEQTLKYSEHLDWHFRLNRRGKDGARTIHSRKWYYNSKNWMQFQEMEDESDRGQSWFDNHPATEYTEEVIEKVPCIAASREGQDFCELCCDKFEQFYNEESDEWQLRNAIKVDDKIYHPICHQDHKDRSDHDQSDDVEVIIDESEPINVDDPSITEEEPTTVIEDTTMDTDTDAESVPRPIKQEKPDVPSVDEKRNSENDDETVSQPTDEQQQEGKMSAVEDDDSDIEEVQLIEQPIEEIIIPDDANDAEDSNLETLLVEDIITEPSLTTEAEGAIQETPAEEMMEKVVDITQSVSTVSIDGNVEPGEPMQQMITAPNKIKITIAKNHTGDKSPSTIAGTPKSSPKSSPKIGETDGDVDRFEKVSDFGESADLNDQPPPPGEETFSFVPTDLKPRLRERKLTEYPPMKRGYQDSGLCSIM